MTVLTIAQALELAVRARQRGDAAEAESLCRQILHHEPGNAGAVGLLHALAEDQNRIGNAIANADQPEEAAAAYRQALRLRPDWADACFNLANMLARLGRLDEAIATYRQVLALQPNDVGACNNLGNALLQKGDAHAALAAYQQALTIQPDHAGTYINCGNALTRLGRYEEAVAACRRAVELDPDCADTHYNLGNACRKIDLLDRAVAAYEQAVRLRPNHAPSLNNLANALKDSGRLDAAIDRYREARKAGADARTAGNLLFALHFHPETDAARLFEEHRLWDETYARPFRPESPRYENDPSPERPLRVGYVSPDFQEHPVARFIRPLLAGQDRSRFEVFCYADVEGGDSMTAALRAHADVWRETAGLTDEALAALIRADRIDILVDLAMHTSRNRLLVFARKPAPVQVTYLSYCGTTGLRTMDWRLTDPYLDPPSEPTPHCSEKSAWIRSFWCYEGRAEAPPVRPPPVLTENRITFGCLNQFCKIAPIVWKTWCRLLRELPGSRLLLHALDGSHRREAIERVRGEGIEPDRLEFLGHVGLPEHLARHERIDIALDPFPYPGGMTTCDALWMGVPVVTLAGRTAVSRGGRSILSNIGLPELVADSTDRYVEIALGLARDRSRLTELRATMRERMRASALMDAPRYVSDIEAAWRMIWRAWTESRNPSHSK